MTPTQNLEAPAIQTEKPEGELDHVQGVVEPSGYRILVRIPRLEEQMKQWAGLVQPAETRRLEEFAQLAAQVIALGPLAYTGKKFGWRWWRRAWCRPGDYVLMRAYSGTRFQVRNQKGEKIIYALINDDTVQGVVRGDYERIERA